MESLARGVAREFTIFHNITITYNCSLLENINCLFSIKKRQGHILTKTEAALHCHAKSNKIWLKALFHITSSSCISTVSMGQISHTTKVADNKSLIFISLSVIISFTCCPFTDLILSKHVTYFV